MLKSKSFRSVIIGTICYYLVLRVLFFACRAAVSREIDTLNLWSYMLRFEVSGHSFEVALAMT